MRERSKQSQRVRPDRLERAQARGLDARLHLLGCTERRQCQLYARGTTEAGWNIADAS
jgi:ribosome modulation factor